MKNFLKLSLISLAISTSANAAEPQALTCQEEKSCLEQDVKAGAYEFTIDQGAAILVEVTGANGASVLVKSDGSSATASYFQMGMGDTGQAARVETEVGMSGKFSIEVAGPKIMVDGQQAAANSDFHVKITRLKSNLDGVSI